MRMCEAEKMASETLARIAKNAVPCSGKTRDRTGRRRMGLWRRGALSSALASSSSTTRASTNTCVVCESDRDSAAVLVFRVVGGPRFVGVRDDSLNI